VFRYLQRSGVAFRRPSLGPYFPHIEIKISANFRATTRSGCDLALAAVEHWNAYTHLTGAPLRLPWR
jgi:hypothetical protein